MKQTQTRAKKEERSVGLVLGWGKGDELKFIAKMFGCLVGEKITGGGVY